MIYYRPRYGALNGYVLHLRHNCPERDDYAHRYHAVEADLHEGVDGEVRGYLSSGYCFGTLCPTCRREWMEVCRDVG